jgi:Ca2+-binding EF-hand superfamily protein
MSQEIEKLASQTFQRYDRNKSGFLEKPEIRLLLEVEFKEFGLEVTDDDVTSLIKTTRHPNEERISKDDYIHLVKDAYNKSR